MVFIDLKHGTFFPINPYHPTATTDQEHQLGYRIAQKTRYEKSWLLPKTASSKTIWLNQLRGVCLLIYGYLCLWISLKTLRWWLPAKLHWKVQASGAIMDPSRRNIFSLSFCKIKDHVSKYKGDPHLYPCKVHLVTGGETWMRRMGCKSTILRLYTRFLLLTCSTDLGQQLKQVIINVCYFSLGITGFC